VATVPYTPNPASIPRFFQHIQAAGVPAKVTNTYLEGVGFKSKNDRYLIAVLKAIGFLDNSGSPTERWRSYRDKAKGPGVLAAGIRHAYSDLFETYPDAYRKDDEAIRNFFSSRTDLGESTLALAVRTFKSLCLNANFEGAELVEETAAEIAELAKPDERPATRAAASGGTRAPVININIQLELPATDDASIYEKLFEAMRKNLLTDGSSS